MCLHLIIRLFVFKASCVLLLLWCLFFISLWDRDGVREKDREIFNKTNESLFWSWSQFWKEIKTDRRHCCCQYRLTRPFVCHPQSFYTNRFHSGSLALCFPSHTVSLSVSFSLCEAVFPLFLPYHLAVMTSLFHIS